VNDYVFFGGKRVARQDSAGTVHYCFSDHLGSTSLITDAVGTMSSHPQAESDYYPYGGEIVITADTTNNHYKFTGKRTGYGIRAGQLRQALLPKFNGEIQFDRSRPIHLRDRQTRDTHQPPRNSTPIVDTRFSGGTICHCVTKSF
jgi:hypothetical protein